MQITHSSIDTQKGPADWFTGDVYIDAIAAPAGTTTFAAALVHFTPIRPQEERESRRRAPRVSYPRRPGGGVAASRCSASCPGGERVAVAVGFRGRDGLELFERLADEA